MNINLPFGLRGKRIVHISEITKNERGLKCNCRCPKCNTPLVAKLGDENVHHFAHSNSNCNYALESALHLFAKELLEEHKKIKLPKVYVNYLGFREDLYPETIITFDNVNTEKRLSSIIPDILLRKGNYELIIEVKVTHEVDDNKISKIKEIGISALEIDLSNFKLEGVNFDREKLSNIILNDVEYKDWLFNAKVQEKKKELKRKAQELKKKKEEEEERKLLAEKQKRKKKIKNIEKLMDKSFQQFLKNKWAKEIINNSGWISTAKYLGISLNYIPNYLNQEIEGEFVFNCDRRYWQATIFSVFIYRRLSQTSSPHLAVEHIVEWLKRKPNPIPLNWDLVYPKDIRKFRDTPGLADVICNFLLNLSKYGFVQPSELTLKKGGDSYYWWFERKEEGFKILPQKYTKQNFREYENKLVNIETGEVVGKLCDLYISKS